MELPVDLEKLFKLIEELHSITAQFRSNGPRPDYEETVETLQDTIWKLSAYFTNHSTSIVALCLGMQYAINGLRGYYDGAYDLNENMAWVVTRYVYYAAKDMETKFNELGE